MPTLVSRDVNDNVGTDNFSGQQSVNVGPNGVFVPVPNTNQMPMQNMHNFTTQLPAYGLAHPHILRRSVDPRIVPMPNQQQLSPPFAECLEGLNGLKLRRPQSISNQDFTNPSHPRYKTYFHLKNLFPEDQVRKAMVQMPNETHPQTLCKAIIQMLPTEYHNWLAITIIRNITYG